MNLFKHELTMYWKNLLFWSIGILGMVGGGMIEFTGYYKADSTAMSQFMDKFPKALLAMFGMVNLDISSLNGYYGILHIYIVIMGSIYAIILGAGILSKEERDKTVEFLLVKPVTRSWVMIQKLCAGIVYIVGFVAVDTLISAIFIAKVAPKEDFSQELMLLMLSMTLIMLAFYSIAFGLSGAMKDNRKSSNIVIALMSVSYLASVYMDLVDNIEWLRPFVLYKYFPSDHIFSDLALEPIYIGFALLWILVGLAMAFIGYPRRDLRI